MSDSEIQVMFVTLGGEDLARNISEKTQNFVRGDFQKNNVKEEGEIRINAYLIEPLQAKYKFDAFTLQITIF